MADPSGDIAAAVGELQRKLELLRTAYEQYFLGMERREPTQLRRHVEKLLRLLDRTPIVNTALKFRLKGLVARFQSYQSYWNRTVRQMEDGTYFRDVARVQRRLAREGIAVEKVGRMPTRAELERAFRHLAEAVARKEQEAAAGGEAPSPAETGPALADLAAQFSQPGVGPAPPRAGGPPPIPADASPRPPAPAPRPAAPERRPPAGDGGLDERRIRDIYERLVAAKQACREDVSRLRYESVRAALARQIPAIRARHPGREIDFEVAIKDGRAVLRARPK